jgi:hypothetical protein
VLIREWLPEQRHPNLLLRVAVREVESWLLADTEHLANYLRVGAARIPTDPDTLPDPKHALVNLARGSKSAAIRSRIVPRPGSTAKQGREYNACLCEFVTMSWHPTAAGKNSPSLSRAIDRISTFRPAWNA